MSIALLCLSTGQAYWQFISPFLHSARTFLPPHIPYLFTDCRKDFGIPQKTTNPEGYPLTTLHRYRTFLQIREQLDRYDHVFYSDIDDLFVSPIEADDICCDGITAVSHAGFHHGDPKCRTYERRPQSTACISTLGDCYYAGGFIGGSHDAFLAMAEAIVKNVDIDEKNGVLAEWHDESHLNRYLLDHPPARVLTPAYHYPEPLLLRKQFRQMWGEDYLPKIVCLEKKWKVA